MGPLLLIVLLGVLIVIAIAAFIVVGGMRTRGQVERALNMTLFLVRVPREAQPAGGAQKQEKEMLAVGEQFLANLSNMHSVGWNKFVYGEPYVALEMAVHHIGEETHFYIAVPKSNEDIIEKQLYGLYPAAEITKTKDYNVFNPQGATAGAYLTYTADRILPIKTYAKLETDPIGG